GAQARGLSQAGVSDFRYVPGKGVIGNVEGRMVILGNLAFLVEQGIDGTRSVPATLAANGRTVMLAAVDGKLAGLLAVADPIRPTTPEAIRQLHADGLRI